jgi:nucleoside recognition membrane protein YjiH
MHATFLQKIIICMIAGFFAACLWQFGIVFVTGADDALNGDFRKKPATATAAHR